MNKLRFIDDPARPGVINMAIDDTLARLIADFDVEAIFRVYGWLTPTLSIGYHQNPVKRLDLKSCLNLGVD
jgi:lipoate-protein ligase A